MINPNITIDKWVKDRNGSFFLKKGTAIVRNICEHFNHTKHNEVCLFKKIILRKMPSLGEGSEKTFSHSAFELNLLGTCQCQKPEHDYILQCGNLFQ